MWKSRYDCEGQGNTEKYFGRKLHVQDNYMVVALVLAPIFGWVLGYMIRTSGDLLWGLKYFYNLLVK